MFDKLRVWRKVFKRDVHNGTFIYFQLSKHVPGLEIHNQPEIQSLELQFKCLNDSTIDFHILHFVYYNSIITIQTNEGT